MSFKCKWCGTNYCRECGRGDFYGRMFAKTMCRVCFQDKCQGERIDYYPQVKKLKQINFPIFITKPKDSVQTNTSGKTPLNKINQKVDSSKNMKKEIRQKSHKKSNTNLKSKKVK